jgi:hypothetical protein
MRQIGARQEAGRIGGIGSCGRELCCSTWLTDFKSVNTHAARYQNLSINQAKLSGQCGRLKCCLNYELDTYMEAIEEFPNDVDVLKFQGGSASLIKMDIFKRLLYYSVEVEKGRNTMMALPLERVKLIKAMNLSGQTPEQLMDPKDLIAEEKYDFADVTGDIELPDLKKKRNKKKKKPGSYKDQPQSLGQPQIKHQTKQHPQQQHRDQPHNKPQSKQETPKSNQDQPSAKQEQRPRPTGEGTSSQQGNQKKNKNRNRNRNRGPRTDGEKPLQNPPTT